MHRRRGYPGYISYLHRVGKSANINLKIKVMKTSEQLIEAIKVLMSDSGSDTLTLSRDEFTKLITNN